MRSGKALYVNRSIETDGLAAKNGIITFCSLAQGLLTDRYLNGIPADSRVRRDAVSAGMEDS